MTIEELFKDCFSAGEDYGYSDGYGIDVLTWLKENEEKIVKCSIEKASLLIKDNIENLFKQP